MVAIAAASSADTVAARKEPPIPIASLRSANGPTTPVARTGLVAVVPMAAVAAVVATEVRTVIVAAAVVAVATTDTPQVVAVLAAALPLAVDTMIAVVARAL